MGGCLCFNNQIEAEIRTESQFKEIKIREDISPNKFLINFQLFEENGIKIRNPIIMMEVIHVDTIDSTMPASRKYIDEGNKLPFIFNTIIQTAGKGKGARKWAGSIAGNVYTSSCIPINMIKNELNENSIIVKITAISIIQQLRQYAPNEFFLKYPNDILCRDKKKLGGIIAETYKDFCIIGFGINIVEKPEQDQIRKEGLLPCCVKEHLASGIEPPTALDFSIEVTKQIIYNLNMTKNGIDELFEKYIKKDY